MISATFEKAIIGKVPDNSVGYCVSLFNDSPFGFRISKDRKSKSGDYRYDKKSNTSIVTVNDGLNPYSFLITLIHEIAHHHTRKNGNGNHKPHGSEWKQEFKGLMLPLLNSLVFPDDILKLLARHMKNPKASTSSDHRLVMALRKYDEESNEDELHLGEIEDGRAFTFNNRQFKKLNKRRTRILCEEIKTGKKYLIPMQAVVTV